MQHQQPLIVGLTELVAKAKPPEREIIVAGIQLNLLRARKHHLDEFVEFIRLLRFLSDFSDENVAGDVR